MLAHGFTTEMLVRLLRGGLASAKAERVVAGGQRLEIARVKITAAGESLAISAPEVAISMQAERRACQCLTSGLTWKPSFTAPFWRRASAKGFTKTWRG